MFLAVILYLKNVDCVTSIAVSTAIHPQEPPIVTCPIISFALIESVPSYGISTSPNS
jgi:hypothetical protein